VNDGALRRGVRRVLPSANDARLSALEEQVAELDRALEESRRLNERLSDVLDVVVELLVPAVDRDDARLEQALAALGKLV
jgi:hypothetical protein